jgi:tripartite motif-containing protein 71
MSQRHKSPGRLGGVALSGAGFLRAIGSQGAGNGPFSRPCGGVAFDGEGNLVVSDGENHLIHMLRYIDGAHLRTIGSRGAGNGQFNCPWGIAFDGAGQIIVVELGGHRVQVLRYSDGAHVRTIGSRGSSNGQFNRHNGGVFIDSDGRIVAADTNNNRAQVLERAATCASPSPPLPPLPLPKHQFSQLLPHTVHEAHGA